MTDPFAGYDPDEDREKLPAIQLARVGDWFEGTVVRIGQRFDTKYGTKYPIELELSQVSIEPLEEIEELQQAYTPPAAGETAVYFATVTNQNGSTAHVGEEIDRAVKKAGIPALTTGDVLAGKLIDKIKSKTAGHKPFKKHGFIVKAGERKPVDPFESAGTAVGDEAPF